MNRLFALISVSILLVLAQDVLAQLREHPITIAPAAMTTAGDTLATALPGAGSAALHKLGWLLGASLVYAGFDYFGYNLSRHDTAQLAGYRILQLMMHGLITWFLAHEVDLATAAGWNIAWWTFGMDILYYGYAEIVNPGPGWDRRGSFYGGVMQNHCNWAYWTPIGLMRGARRDKVIAGNTLVAQALVGAALAITVSLTF